jgi:hypothetical protein
MLREYTFNNIGLLHNEILHSLVLNKSNLNSTEDYYYFMENLMRNEFPEYEFSEEIGAVILSAMKSNDDGNAIIISEEHQLMYNNLESAFKSQDEAKLLTLIAEYEQIFENDQIALQGIATAYHTWYFWKNLEG